ncbi:2810_t:CDS:2, partial [Racocetra fulgida]
DDDELPGYDGLVFLFNDSNEDTIMEKIDENTLEEESKLPLASGNKVKSNPLQITKDDLKQLSQDFADHIKWECDPAPKNIQNYFDNHCEKLDN